MIYEGLFYKNDIPVKVGVEEGIIKHIDTGAGGDNIYIAPGFIDQQVNGYVTVGFAQPDLDVEKIREATGLMYKTGVTTYLPTVITSSKERLLRNFKILAAAAKEPDLSYTIPGFHLEGPYISPVDGFRGAHSEQWVHPPDWNEFMEIYEAADEKIIQVSLAPEVEGAIDFIKRCRELNITVALAHHNGSADQIRDAVQAGASLVTHLGNGLANNINRHNNPLWPQLAYDELAVSLIADGFHLTPEQMRVFYRAKTAERTILVSDMTELAGMEPGEYEWDNKTVVLEPEGVIKYPAQNVLAGAAAPLIQGIGNIMEFTGCTLEEAVHMATRNPARENNLTDRGVIEEGKRADLVLFTLEKGVLSILKTVKSGEVVYEKA